MKKWIMLPALIAFTAPSALAASMPGTLVGEGGKAIGKIEVKDAPRGVLLRIEAKGLTPGWHGVHFHETGTCADAGFKASGSHVHGHQGEGKPALIHGLLNPNANEHGDLPNVHVAANGTLNAELYTTLVSLNGAEGRPALKDSDGSALVIHENADDHMSQPIGGAGARVACAVIP